MDINRFTEKSREALTTWLLNMLLTPEQQKQYDTYMKTLSDFNL